MNRNTYKYLRIGIAVFTMAIVGLAVARDTIILAIVGVFTGMVFTIVARSKADIQVDERDKMVREKAAQAAYAIFAPTIGLGAFFLFLLSRGEQYFLEAIAIVLAYLSFFLMGVYAISLVYFNLIFGGDGKE